MLITISMHIPDASDNPEQEAAFALGLIEQDIQGELTPGTHKKIKDVNGNAIGYWSVISD